jgi:hypothetical protein
MSVPCRAALLTYARLDSSGLEETRHPGKLLAYSLLASARCMGYAMSLAALAGCQMMDRSHAPFSSAGDGKTDLGDMLPAVCHGVLSG